MFFYIFQGAIFHENSYDAELAFRNAIARENTYHYKDLELVPIIKKIDLYNSFEAEKVACGLISEGVVAIFGPGTPETTSIQILLSLLLSK